MYVTQRLIICAYMEIFQMISLAMKISQVWHHLDLHFFPSNLKVPDVDAQF